MARKKEFDEKEVLKKAMVLFQQRGFNGVSAQDLVDFLGISRSSLYDTYGDKRNLFLLALKNYKKEMANSVIKLLNTSKNIQQTLELIFKSAVVEAIEDKLLKGCFMVNTTIELAPHDKEIATIVSQNMKDMEDAICKALEKGQKQGVISNKRSARSLSHYLFNCMSGIRVASKSEADKKTLDDIVAISLSVLKD